MTTQQGVNVPEPGPSPSDAGEEEVLVAQVHETARALEVEPARLLTLYVALKSKPLLIVCGPAQSGKVAAVQALARLLTGGVSPQVQEMVGHPWWASGCRDMGMLAEAQSRFNSGKIQAILEEASRPGNSRRLFMAFMLRISPAELAGLFAELAAQIPLGYIWHLSGAELERPVRFPPNVVTAGTLDTTGLTDWEEATLRHTAVVAWPASGALLSAPPHAEARACDRLGAIFLRSHIRSEQKAASRLRRLSGWRSQALRPLFEIVGILQDHGLRLPASVFGEALVFVANSFTEGGSGVFETGARDNTLVALDAAFAASLLPRIERPLLHSRPLRRRLSSILASDFPTSAAFLASQEAELGGALAAPRIDTPLARRQA